MENNWKNEFEHYLPFLGHRNWVLVVDKAFPMQSSPAMKILNSNEQLTDVLPYVLGQISALPHVRPVVYVEYLCSLIVDIGPKRRKKNLGIE